MLLQSVVCLCSKYCTSAHNESDISSDIRRGNSGLQAGEEAALLVLVAGITQLQRANMIKSIGSADEHKRIFEWMAAQESVLGKPIGGSPLSVGSIYVKFGRKRERI